ncbi:hypothetical protein ACJVDH_14460 [Pedobacter sp. AW1-32]|uniref:hypothetical protein n=1 Tax=Pedobacter sp. AW1-32 TaxID=3383026 RepID=UPI003FEF1A80
MLKPINVAKAYYRKKIQMATGKSDEGIDQYLDSLYLRHYTEINEGLKHQKTLDALFLQYKTLETQNVGKGIVYVAGTDTKNLNSLLKSKMQMLINSEDPYTAFYDDPNCIPLELTDWFDQQYDKLYTDLMASFKAGGFNTALSLYHEKIASLPTDDCIQDLLGVFFETVMGLKYNEEWTPGSTLDPYTTMNCGDAVTTTINSLNRYYGCLNQNMPSDLAGILADGDPFEGSLTNMYFTNYQLTLEDQAIINQINYEDQQANLSLSYLCNGAPNLAGNLFFNGNREHWLTQLYYLSLNVTAQREYWIPETSSNNPANPGRADLANTFTGEIFEIKSEVTEANLTAGRTEVNNYVEKANQHCRGSLGGGISSWVKGTNFAPVILPYSATQNLQALLIEPALIGYNRIPIQQIPALQPTPQSVAEKFKSLIERLKSFQNFNFAYNYDRIISEFMRDNPDVAGYVRAAAIGAAVTLVVGTIVEDFLTAGVGVVDDIPTFILAYRIFRVAALM